MTEPTETSMPLNPSQRKRAIATWEAQRLREREDSLAVLNARRRAEKFEERYRRIFNLWPLWVGMLVGLMSPAIQFVATAIGPWCMALVFPFVVLAKRPEIQVGPVTHVLPIIMLYAQFPLEGLLANSILKRDVRPLGVVGQVMLFHFLGLTELWMVSGGGFNFLR